MFGLGWQEMLVILLVILLLFGAKRLPDIAKGLGKGIREFKGAVKETQKEIQNSMDDSDKPAENSNDK
jgi:sec-independent protein translocase protein TatA